MKHLISFLVFAAFSFGVSAQPVRLEHNIQLGLGIYTYGPGVSSQFRLGHLAGRLSYGLDIYCSDRWSVMPEAGGKFYWEGAFAIGAVGANFDSFSYLDFTVSARYHFADGMILGLGPMLSYTWTPGKYYIDADPSDPLNGKAKNTPLNLSLRPSLTFATAGRWRFGVEAEIGLLNVMVQYPEYGRTGNRHIHAVRLVVGVRF